MIDAKRLAEMMEPGKLRGLAAGLDVFRNASDQTDELDILETAAAVLREEARRKEAVWLIDSEAATGLRRALSRACVEGEPRVIPKRPPPPKGSGDRPPGYDCPECGARHVHETACPIHGKTDKVIEVDLDDLWHNGGGECLLWFSETGRCKRTAEVCEIDKAAPGTCPLRKGRIVIQAKAAEDKPTITPEDEPERCPAAGCTNPKPQDRFVCAHHERLMKELGMLEWPNSAAKAEEQQKP